MFLLDTDVLSFTSPTSNLKAEGTQAWRRWVETNENVIFFSVVTLMEVQFEIEKSLARGATHKAARLQFWLTAVETLHRGRILPVSIDIARRAGQVLHAAVAKGISPSSEDALIAATAESMGFTLLSRNARDMQAMSANWLNPIDIAPPKVGSRT